MNVCIYGASSGEMDPIYEKETEKLGMLLAQNGHTLLFGGGATGMMGAAARGFKKAGGRVIGVAPSFFNVDGVLYDNCDEMVYTVTMRERKQYLEEHSDCFIAAPGGIGTMDELFEIYTLRNLEWHKKPIFLLNVNGYYDTLLSFLSEMIEKKALVKNGTDTLKIAGSAEELVAFLNDNC